METAESIESVVNELNEETPETITKPNPTVVTLIMATTKEVLADSPNDKEEDILFLTTLDYLKGIVTTDGPDAMAGVVFSYYLEAYRAFQLIKQNDASDGQTPLGPDVQLSLYTDAAISLLDVYLRYPTMTIARRMMALVGASLHQIITTHQSSVEDRPMEQVLADLSTVAFICQTLKEYVKGKRRRQNFAYVTWLKSFFQRATSTNDLSFMREDETLKKVVAQISSGSRTIIV